MALGPLRMAVQQLMPRRAHDEDRHGVDGLDEVIEQVEKRGLRGMDVIDDHHQRLLAGERLEQLARSPEELRNGELPSSETHRRCDAVHHRGAVPFLDTEILDQEADLRDRRFDGVVGCDLGDASHDLGDRPERDAVAVRQTAATDDMRVAGHGDRELPDKS
jgi:hypothetical protein